MTPKQEIELIHRQTAQVKAVREEIEAMNRKDEIPPHENDEFFPKEPDFYERNYGEYADEKRLDDRDRARDMNGK